MSTRNDIAENIVIVNRSRTSSWEMMAAELLCSSRVQPICVIWPLLEEHRTSASEEELYHAWSVWRNLS